MARRILKWLSILIAVLLSAVMLVLGGILAMVGCDLAHRHVTGDGLP